MNKLVYRLKNNHVSYFLYFLKNTNWNKLITEIRFVTTSFGKNAFTVWLDMIFTSLSMGFSFHEYFYYSFYTKTKRERESYASMAYMYEYQLLNNPKPTRYYLENKHVFLAEYSNYIGRSWLNLSEASIHAVNSFLVGKEKAVLKNAMGGAGKSVKIISTNAFNAETLLSYSKSHNFNLIEEFVYQHKEIMALSPNSLNTIRLVTQISKSGEVDVIGTLLRMGIESNTDNLSTGGIACPIDPESGIISGPAISFDNTKPDYKTHPVSGMRFEGFEIPFWPKVLQICKEAALLHPENKSIGWDVAIKDDGPILIEGNHDWGARLWQMPGKQGLKHIAVKYFNK